MRRTQTLPTDPDDDEPIRCESHDEPTIAEQRQQQLEEAQEFHDEWSRQNPNRVYGQSIY